MKIITELMEDALNFAIVVVVKIDKSKSTSHINVQE